MSSVAKIVKSSSSASITHVDRKPTLLRSDTFVKAKKNLYRRNSTKSILRGDTQSSCQSTCPESGEPKERRASVRFSVDLTDVMFIADRLTLQAEEEQANQEASKKLLQRADSAKLFAERRRVSRSNSGIGRSRRSSI